MAIVLPNLSAIIRKNPQILGKAKSLRVRQAQAVNAQVARAPAQTQCILFEGADLNADAKKAAGTLIKIYRQGRLAVQKKSVPNDKTKEEYTIQAYTLPNLLKEYKTILERATAKRGGIKVQLYPVFLTGKTPGAEDVIRFNPAGGTELYGSNGEPVRTQRDIQRAVDALGNLEELYHTCWHEQRRDAVSGFTVKFGTGVMAFGLINVRVVISYKSPSVSDGRLTVPQELLDSNSVLTWTGADSKRDLCFWMCLAHAKWPSLGTSTRMHVPAAIGLYEKFYKTTYQQNTSHGFSLSDLADVEAAHGVHFHVYEYVGDRKVRTLRRPVVAEGAHPLLYYKYHMMTITSLETLTQQYVCRHEGCGHVSTQACNCAKHEETCPRGRTPVESIPKNTMAYGQRKLNALLKASYKFNVRLSDDQKWFPAGASSLGVDWNFPWTVKFDCEAFLHPTTPADAGRQYVHAHTLACVALSAHPDLGIPSKVFTITDYNGSTDALMYAVVAEFLNPAQEALVRLADAKWGAFRDTVRSRLADHYARRQASMQPWQETQLLAKEKNRGMTVEQVFKRKVESALDTIHEYMYCLPVLAHNASKYDNNLVFKDGFLQPLLQYERNRLGVGSANPIKHTISHGAFGYKEVRLERFVFLDSMHYTGPCTLSDFCKEQLGKETKLFFPYTSMVDMQVLQTRTSPPTKDEFWSDLSCKNPMQAPPMPQHCSKTVYTKAKKEMKEAADNWEAFLERQWKPACARMPETPWIAMLEDYCFADTEPFRDAWLVFQQKFWDLYKCVLVKDAVGIPGIAEKIMTEMAINAVLDKYPAHVFPPAVDAPPTLEDIQKRIQGYIEQDAKKGLVCTLTPADVLELWHAQSGHCMYARTPCGAAYI